MKNEEQTGVAKSSGKQDFSVAAPRGFLTGTASCGLKKSGEDLAIVFSEYPAVAAAVFTTNLVQAAPVVLSKAHLKAGVHRVFVVNSGCANACTGEPGMEDARQTARIVAEYFHCDEREVLVASTGVIGVRLDMNKLVSGLRTATAALSRENGRQVAEAIMTTDTRPKRAAKTIRLGGKRVTIAGVAKGAGMIHPNMATMLSLVTTDAAISKAALQRALNRAVNLSFNRVTIDGDTSTNDSCVLIASGAAGGPVLQPGHADWSEFALGVERVFVELARAIVRDGEGATKLVTVSVTGGDSEDACLRAAYAVAESPLVKTALFASDPNWGRILAAVGRSGVSGLRISDIHISIGGVPIVAAGEPVPGYDEAAVAEVMRGAEYEIAIGIGAGPARTAVLTCDFSFDYVKINAEYRS